MIRKPNANKLASSQRGVALIVSLVMLVAITLIGVFAMSNSRLEWLMTSNSAFQSDASLRAQAAAEDGIRWAVNSDLHHLFPTAPPADPLVAANWNPPSPLSSAAGSASSITTPGSNKYFVEAMGCYDEKYHMTCDSDSCRNSTEQCLYTYQVWAWASDERGTSRIVRATVIKEETTSAAASVGQAASYTPILQYKSYSEVNQ